MDKADMKAHKKPPWIYQVREGLNFVTVEFDRYIQALKQGYKVRKSRNGYLWTEPGPPHRIKDFTT